MARPSGRAAAKAREQIFEIGREWRFEDQLSIVGGMIEAEAEGMQGLAAEGDRTQRVRTVDVAFLADQGVAAKARLDPDLIPTTGLKPHLDERRVAEALDDVVFADG